MQNPPANPIEKGMCDICHRYREREESPKEHLLLCDECMEKFASQPKEEEDADSTK